MIRYVNVTMNNPQGLPSQTAQFDNQYDRNILTSCQDNLMAVVNFSLPLQNLPLFIFPVVPGQTDPNLSTLVVGICQNATQSNIDAGISAPVVNFPQTLEWVPANLTVPVPSQVGQTVQNLTPYYWGYSYQHFVNLVNTAIQAAWAAANTAEGVTIGLCPIFAYDAALHTFSWILSTTFTDDATGSPPGWSVFWNQAFDSLVNNFNTIENSPDFFILENVKSRLTNLGSALILPTGYTSSTTITLAQDFTTLDNFNTAERILIISTSIPVVPDFFASNYIQNQNNGGALSNFERVMVDTTLDFDANVGAQRSTFVYNPALYQYADLQSSLPLTRISLRCVWMDSLGNFNDIPIMKGDVATVKLGFYSKKLRLMDK